MAASAAAVLFDLDGTLLLTGGAGGRAMARALEEVLGLRDPLAQLHLDGMTDRAIVREAVDHARAHPCAEEEIDRALERYLAILEDELARAQGYRVLPGVTELVPRLAAQGLAVGLGTGNVERGARLKLEPSGLNPHLAFGGFGSDAEPRPAILAAGIARAGKALGRKVSPSEVWVVGDTPRDIAAARAVGARVLAVATGRYSVDELRAHQPDCAFADLAKPGVEAIFLSAGGSAG